MDPATILMVIGAYYALTRGFRAVRAASRASSAAAIPRSARRAGGGMPSWLNRQRHTGAGWWAGEARHGFPVFRAGVREGWTHHQTAMAQRQAQLARVLADGHARQLTYQQERDAHRQRLAAARQEAERQKKAAAAAAAATAAAAKPASTRTPAIPVMAPPPSPPPSPGGRAAPRSPAPAPSAKGKPPAGGTTTTGGTMSDTTFEGTEKALDDIRAKLDYAVNDDEISAAESMADALPASLPDDAETVSHIADLAAALREAKEAQQRAIDACEAAKASHEKNNRPSKEAADATGGAPEREYVTGG